MLSTGSIVLAGTRPAVSRFGMLGDLAQAGVGFAVDRDGSCLAERIWRLTQAPHRVGDVCAQLAGGGTGARTRWARVQGVLEDLVERELLELVPG